MSPPPPIGTTIVSTSGRSSSTSSPSEPWPAWSTGSSKGWTNDPPRLLGVREQALVRLGGAVGVEVDLGAVRLRRLHLARVRLAPHEDAAGDAVERRRVGRALGGVARRPGDDAARLLLRRERRDLRQHPRGLKEPVRWKSSALRCASAPIRSDSARDEKSGVRWSRPPIASRAARTSSREITERPPGARQRSAWASARHQA